jgi:hypothetical protein
MQVATEADPAALKLSTMMFDAVPPAPNTLINSVKALQKKVLIQML